MKTKTDSSNRIQKLVFLAMSLGISKFAIAGDLDGIGILISIAIVVLGFTLFCWVTVLVNAIRHLKGIEIKKTKTYIAQVVLVIMSLSIVSLYVGKPEVQLLGAAFFQVPLLVFLVVSGLRKLNGSE